MSALLGIYLIALSIVLVLIIRADAIAGRCQLVSIRNLFIGGLILFQTVSGSLTLISGFTEIGAEVPSYLIPGSLFCLVLTVFIVIFLSTYRRAEWVERFAIRRTRIRVSSKTRLVIAGLVLTGIGCALRFGGERIPYVAVLLPQIAAGCICGGAILIAIAWARSSWNIVVLLNLLVACGAGGAALLVGAFGRRELLGLMIAVAWGLYQEKWCKMPVTRLLPRATLALTVALAGFTVFSASRVSGENVDRSLAQQVQRFFEIDPKALEEMTIASLSGQFAGGISMWIIDERLNAGGYTPLHSFVYLATMPIPRDYWPDKPVGLGMIAVDEAGITGVSEGHSWGPGLVGHLWHDIALFSTPLYAVLLAFAFRYMDSRTVWSTNDPIAVAMFGSALGQVIGMPRGDIGLFMFNLLSAFLGVWFFGRLIGYALLPIDRDAEWEWREQAESGDDGDATEHDGYGAQHAYAGDDADTADAAPVPEESRRG